MTSAYKDKRNIATIAWHAPLSRKPPTLCISVAREHLSCELIQKSGEFIVNIPDEPLLKEAVLCGSVSGRERDKFTEARFTPAKAKRLVKTPVIEECPAHLECSVRDIKDCGDHRVFIGEIIYAEAEEALFKETWDVDKVKLIYHLGGSRFTVSGQGIEVT